MKQEKSFWLFMMNQQKHTATNLTLYLADFPNDLKGYTKTTQIINEKEVVVYKYKEDSRFVICYGMNIETGKYEYYKYDTEEGTFQIWDTEEMQDLQNDIKTYKFACILFLGGLLFAFILILCLLKKKKKRNKKEKKKELKKEVRNIKREEEIKEEEPITKNETLEEKLKKFDQFDIKDGEKK